MQSNTFSQASRVPVPTAALHNSLMTPLALPILIAPSLFLAASHQEITATAQPATDPTPLDLTTLVLPTRLILVSIQTATVLLATQLERGVLALASTVLLALTELLASTLTSVSLAQRSARSLVKVTTVERVWLVLLRLLRAQLLPHMVTTAKVATPKWAPSATGPHLQQGTPI